MLDVKYDIRNCDILESLDTLFRIHSIFFQTKLLVFVNIHHFFSHDELETIYAAALYRKLYVLCIENEPVLRKIANERWIILDKDHCLTYNENEA